MKVCNYPILKVVVTVISICASTGAASTDVLERLQALENWKQPVSDALGSLVAWAQGVKQQLLILELRIGSFEVEQAHSAAACQNVMWLAQQEHQGRLPRRVTESGGKPSPRTLSLHESLGFFSEPNEQWELRKRIHIAQVQRDVYFKEQAVQECQYCHRGALWFQIHYEPSFSCTFERRLGRMGEGGKWVCDPHRITQSVADGRSCLVYSFGSNNDLSFETSVHSEISSRCEVHIFDPQPLEEGLLAKHGRLPINMTYHAYGLAARGSKGGGKPLAEIVEELGHVPGTIDILKIDCEGCEWSTYREWLDAGVRIRQILIELHWEEFAPGAGAPVQAHQFFNFLFDHGYVIFHKESNTFGCSGECIEYSFLKMHPAFGRSQVMK